VAKIKVRPEDFIVDELLELPLHKKGDYTILKLRKEYWNTLDVIDFVARKMHVKRTRFARAGLKDRYSLSTQYLSFKGNVEQRIKEEHFTLTPIGKSNVPVQPRMLQGNSFNITLRNMTDAEVERSRVNTQDIFTYGFPNYFDEQRFGSARHRQGFIAKRLIHEHYKGALKLLLAYPYKEDGSRERRFKRYCMNHWRDWQGCLNLAPPFYRPIIEHLIKSPKDFKGAIKEIDREFLNLYLLAYQSFLFNEVLMRVVKKYGVGKIKKKYSQGELIFYKRLRSTQNVQNLRIPMINEKTKPAGAVGPFIKTVLKKEDITLKGMAMRKMRLRGVRFKPFERAAIVVPADLVVTKPQPDEIYRHRYQSQVKCVLPPGTYATILIKRLLL
jgi:tRNA pseudouridine13 synthase